MEFRQISNRFVKSSIIKFPRASHTSGRPQAHEPLAQPSRLAPAGHLAWPAESQLVESSHMQQESEIPENRRCIMGFSSSTGHTGENTKQPNYRNTGETASRCPQYTKPRRWSSEYIASPAARRHRRRSALWVPLYQSIGGQQRTCHGSEEHGHSTEEAQSSEAWFCATFQPQRQDRVKLHPCNSAQHLRKQGPPHLLRVFCAATLAWLCLSGALWAPSSAISSTNNAQANCAG